jgi:PAS domain S-box-containing protein
VDDLRRLCVFDEAVDGVIAFRDDNRYVYANRSALRLYERPALVGEPVGCFADAPIDARMTRFQTQGFGSGEVSIHTGNGGRKRLRYRGITNYAPNLHLSVFRDAESSAPPGASPGPARAALFQAAFENAPDAVLLTDDERRYLAGNGAARRFLGVSRERLLASRVDDYTPPSMHGELDKIWEGFLKQGSMEGVFPLLLSNGLQRPVRFRATANITPGRHLCTVEPVGGAHPASDPRLEESAAAVQLTFREREVLTWLARGMRPAAIADQTGLAPQTIRTHMRNAMRRIGAKSRAHAIAIAIQQRQIDP